ncbi:SAM-dependent methyltransferase [Actinoplanes tereljensis]|uniref:class I SAM-dependent methyltransferase n=1 Tax=Paractinoplanes tereljensis TaxID=571912 RepID=UPI00194532B3|nr:class I SAM-dependent methyltransferase [Actinoplanes tereljensis]
MTLERVRDAYSSAADLYIGLYEDGWRGAHPDDLAIIGEHLSGRSGPVLDVGCGPGHYTDYLRSLGADASGLDMVPKFIAHAQANHPDLSFRLGSMDDLGVPDHSVTGILAWYSLIHRPPAELPGVLAEFRRALTPGGALVVGFFDGDEVEPFDHRVVTAYRWPADEMSKQLAAAGFTEAQRAQRDTDRPDRKLAAIAATAN